MKSSIAAAAAALSCFVGNAANAAVIYSENFDVSPAAAWTTNNNNLGTNAVDYSFDYSTIGIPSASGPGGTTRGLKLGANLNSATAPTVSSQIPGISVSPTGKSFVGDYELSFKWWANYIGPLGTGATGSTMLSSFGIMTSGTTANYPGASDAVSFAATGDGQSSADYRIYSKERQTGYVPTGEAGATAADAHASYAAGTASGSRNQTAALYTTLFPAGATAPGSQAALATQSGGTVAGAAGFRWNDVKINKTGDIVTWTVNGTLLGTVDASTFIATVGGGNIFFGMADTNNTTNSNAQLLQDLQFTLVDDVQVTGVPEPSALALVALCGLGLAANRGRRQA